MPKHNRFRVLALCCASQQRAVAIATGAEPYISPPASYDTFKLGEQLRTRGPFDLLYLSLHGYPDVPYLIGDQGLPAVSTADFQGIDLSNTVVFSASCHFTETPFVSAILACNPKLLIGGPGRNYTRSLSIVGANLLGHLFRRALQHNYPAHLAFLIAKSALNIRTYRLKKRKDQLPPPDHSDDRTYNLHLKLAEDIYANLDALKFHPIQATVPGTDRTPDQCQRLTPLNPDPITKRKEPHAT